MQPKRVVSKSSTTSTPTLVVGVAAAAIALAVAILAVTGNSRTTAIGVSHFGPALVMR
jgi:hypothetical protein